MIRRIFYLSLIAVLLTAALTACAPSKSSMSESNMDGLKMASMSSLTPELRQTSANVQEAYRFAIANPDILQQIPCYCGCGQVGHKSNYACYIKDNSGGKLTFDQHATGCSICVDITRDTMNMLKQGKSVAQIKATIDQTYSQYGPSNIQ